MFDSAATVYNNVITLCAFENDRCSWNAQLAYVFGMTKLIDYSSLTTVASHTHIVPQNSHIYIVHISMVLVCWTGQGAFLLFRFILSYSMCTLYSVHGTTFKHIEPKRERKKTKRMLHKYTETQRTNKRNMRQHHMHNTIQRIAMHVLCPCPCLCLSYSFVRLFFFFVCEYLWFLSLYRASLHSVLTMRQQQQQQNELEIIVSCCWVWGEC